MTSKGYSAVPMDEPRESVDVESRVDEADEPYTDDPDAESRATDRLLPHDSAGNDDDHFSTSKRPSYARRVGRSLLAGPRYCHNSLRAFGKRHSARSIVLVSLIGFLMAATIGLSISTGILAGRPEHCYGRQYGMSYTRLPWVYGGVQTRNYRLDFAALYPPLARDADESCKEAWSQLDYIPCHEKLLNRAWDNGKQQSVFEPRPDAYASYLSTRYCIESLEGAYRLLSSQCTARDSFDSSNYLGPLTADPLLESSPVLAVETLLRRVQHMSRSPPRTRSRYSWTSNKCVAELYQDWFIIDGMNGGNLEGLAAFEKGTAQKVEDEYRYTGTSYDDTCDNIYAYSYRYNGDSANKGPDPGDTTCSWCLLNWFDRKLQSWKEGEVFDPVNGTVVSLPDYLTRIRHAGQRCQTEDWQRIYRKNIWAYKEKGVLPDDWSDEDSKESQKWHFEAQAHPLPKTSLEILPEESLIAQHSIAEVVDEPDDFVEEMSL